MNGDGEVAHDIVLQILSVHSVTISRVNYGGFENYRLAQDGIVATISIDGFFSRRVLQYLKRTFDIPIDHFYHPERGSGFSEGNKALALRSVQP